MRIYWYWPHPHRTTSELATSVLREGDQLTVQALRGYRGETIRDSIVDYEMVRDLPDPSPPAGESRFNRPLRRLLHLARRLRARSRLVRTRNFDVAHLQLVQYQSDWVALAFLKRHTKIVAVVHDVRPHVSRMPRFLETWLLRRLYSPRSTDALVVYHPVLKERLIGEFGVDAGRIHVVPLPIKTHNPAPVSPASGHGLMILFFGTFRFNKGLPILIEAIGQLHADRRRHFVIAGRGEGALEQQVRDLAGRRPDVRAEIEHIPDARKTELFARANLVVLPYTDFASQSGVLADAYSSSTPLLVSDVGALGPTVRDDGTGWVVPAGEPDALAAVLRLVSEKPTELVCKREAIAAAVSRHDYAHVGPLLRAIYGRTTNGARRRQD
jgi:glycosyltransferase involved in cell wall biosynthesis